MKNEAKAINRIAKALERVTNPRTRLLALTVVENEAGVEAIRAAAAVGRVLGGLSLSERTRVLDFVRDQLVEGAQAAEAE